MPEPVIKVVQDSLPYAGIGVGGTMTQAPVSWVQVIGLIIGGLGFLAAMLRWYEVKRSNDLDREKWEYQRESKDSTKEANTYTETNPESKSN